MSKTLYEEALIDLEQLKQVAESNAKNAIIDAITPKIKRLIEKQLIDDYSEADSLHDDDLDDDDILMDLLDDKSDSTDISGAQGIELSPDGTVTLDLGEFLVSDEESEELDGEQIVEPVVDLDDDLVFDTTESIEEDDGEEEEDKTKKENESTNKTLHATSTILEIKKTIMSLISDVKKRKLCDVDALLHRTECIYNEVQESNIDKDKLSLYENKLENVYKQLQLLKKENNNKENTMLNEEEVLLKLDLGDEVDVDADAVDVEVVASDEEAGEEEEMELDDEVLEIDEKDLVRELNRLRASRSTVTEEDEMEADAGADAAADDSADDSADVDVDAASTALQDLGTALGLSVAVETDDAAQEEDAEEDEMEENRRTRFEARRLRRNGQLAERGSKNKKVNTLAKQLKEYKSAVAQLRKKLTETNLFNAKLLYTNKMLQNENITSKQKLFIAERLDEARSLREVKIIFNSLADSMSLRRVNESARSKRRVLGSSSKTTRTSAANLNESVEAQRWAKLAGLK